MPIIVFALLLFVLLAFAGVVLLSLALRYRAGTARRQARPWVASLNVWMTSVSAVFFLSFTFLLSFWVAGKISVEPQSENRVRVTFPLGFKLRNGNKQSSGKVDKTLVLEPAGDDLQIVAVNEGKAG